jgi:hypothetical protein
MHDIYSLHRVTRLPCSCQSRMQSSVCGRHPMSSCVTLALPCIGPFVTSILTCARCRHANSLAASFSSLHVNLPLSYLDRILSILTDSPDVCSGHTCSVSSSFSSHVHRAQLRTLFPLDIGFPFQTSLCPSIALPFSFFFTRHTCFAS